MKKTILFSLALLCLNLSCKKDSQPDNTTPAAIAALTCTSGAFSSIANHGVAFYATATLPYSGGNGSSYPTGADITSTGVTGLTARLQAGTLSKTTGNITFAVSGIPVGTGMASFPISFGGQSCTLNLTVN